MKLAVGLMEGVESVRVELLGTFTDAAGKSYPPGHNTISNPRSH